MKILKILDWPSKRYYGETHHFYRWRDRFTDHNFKIEFFFDHRDKGLEGADYLLIHSRYFGDGWQNVLTRTVENEAELINYLLYIKKHVGKLIWFDASDSTGSTDFSIIPYVDIFLKKQLLLDKDYYTSSSGQDDIRIWLNDTVPVTDRKNFVPCCKSDLGKLRLGWNLALNDYRYFGYKMSRLSNYVSYDFYPLRYTSVEKKRPYDLAFRGTIHTDTGYKNSVSHQRTHIINLFDQLNLRIAKGGNVSKAKYWRELRNSKLSISPYGWGEICYRDFETFISGSILIKPVMSHMVTFPDLYVPYETYVPVPWNLSGLKDLLEQLITNYSAYKNIAEHGQESYRNAINDAEGFIQSLKQSIE